MADTPKRCPYVNANPEIQRAPFVRGDQWQCGDDAGHGLGHVLYSADRERVLDVAGPWVLPATEVPQLDGSARGAVRHSTGFSDEEITDLGGLPGENPPEGDGHEKDPGQVTVYVAGPMTGYPEFNYPAFEAARAQLEDLGYHVLCPTDTEKGNTTGSVREWDWYMRHALRMVLDADGIALLPGWQASKGATLERHVAQELDVPVAEVGQWIEAAPRGVTVESWPTGVPA